MSKRKKSFREFFTVRRSSTKKKSPQPPDYAGPVGRVSE